jgi:fructosamine-3-kinase
MKHAAGGMDAARNHILQKHQVAPEAWLSSGMEVEVYTYGPDAVLKLYAGTTSLADLLTLQAFYNVLDRQHVPYGLPRIHTVAQEDHFLITIEQRLASTRLSALLPRLTTDQLETVMQRYLNAALAVSSIQTPPAWDRYKLFDPDHLSTRSDGDWHQFLARYLRHKLAQVSPYLSRDVSQFAAKVEHLQAILDQPYRGEYRLIHGDFCPSNLLVSADTHVTALLDFGLLTMVGDRLFDLATGWVFFDMYDELKAQVRDRYLAMLLDRLGEQVRGRLYRYVLIYRYFHSTHVSRHFRRRSSARSSIPCMTCPTCSTRSRMNHRAAGRSTRALPRRWDWATRQSGVTRRPGSTG